MAARQRETDFNNYFDFLWEQAQERKLTKGQFMKASGLSAQRFSEFTQQSRNVTAEYFLKMLGGLGLAPEDVEKGSGIPFSEDQSVQLKFDSFVSSQRAFIEELMRNPEKLRACKAVVALGGLGKPAGSACSEPVEKCEGPAPLFQRSGKSFVLILSEGKSILQSRPGRVMGVAGVFSARP